ncbi:MAG: hypothetical protein V3T21_01835, partial [Candidatus Margulisiibacteriota bacterium]
NPSPAIAQQGIKAMRINNRLLVSSAYLFGIPALYIVLTDNRKREYVGYHGMRAFLLWVLFFVIFFSLRSIIDLVWSTNFIPQLEKLEIISVVLMGAFAVFCGYRGFVGR